jgi:Mg-chelatase subunit ChlD
MDEQAPKTGKQTGRNKTGKQTGRNKTGKQAGRNKTGKQTGRNKTESHPTDTHLVVLLDRSGSMAAIADDVIGGFNAWLRDQQASGDDAVVTLVLFDSIDQHEVVADAVQVADVEPLDAATFTPRAATPLLDATSLVIARARRREEDRKQKQLPSEAVVIVSITDGHENDSTECSVGQIRTAIAERERSGWKFVFLSAALDVYEEAGSLGYGPHNTQAFHPDEAGTAVAFASLSQGTAMLRERRRHGAKTADLDLWESGKPAEADRNKRQR